MSQVERCYKIIMAGVEQFGGLNEKAPVIEAYKMGVAEHDEAFMRKRFEESAYRLLKNIFQVGLFENSYLNPEEVSRIVGCPEYMAEGFDVQIRSVVMLKNKNNVLPLAPKTKVYVPQVHIPRNTDWMGTGMNWSGVISDDRTKKYVHFAKGEN